MIILSVAEDKKREVEQIIATQDRLHEVVSFSSENFSIKVSGDEIEALPRWGNEHPPFVFKSPILFSSAALLSLLYVYLDNFEKAYEYSEVLPDLQRDIDSLNRLQHGITLSLETEIDAVNASEEYRQHHNLAVMAHYGSTAQFYNFSHIEEFYMEAMKLANTPEQRAYTGKNLATMFLDCDELALAHEVLEGCLNSELSKEAQIELKNIQYSVWLKSLTVPYDSVLLDKIKETIWEVLSYFERENNGVQQALVLIDAAHVANLSDSFSESLGYITKAIQLLEAEDIPELVANAQFRKGVLLYTWAQNGNPQFFRPALDAYQQALKLFTAEATPEVFAEIQHHLGVIYSEIPDEVKKKSIWAAVSISSFNKALEFYSPQTHPYEYAMICNSYGNAFTKYPEGVKSDNYAKALDYYKKALEIRTAKEFPMERAMTIMNYLEAAWYLSLEEREDEVQLFDEMNQLASEIKSLSDDVEMLISAENHLQKLGELKALI